MATPTADIYSVASGATVYGGRYGPAVASFALFTGAAEFAGSASQGAAQAAFALAADGAVFAGSVIVAPPPTYALVGDSLTYGGASDIWMNGMLGGKLRRLGNFGWDGVSVYGCLNNIDNNYRASPPGLAGLPEPLGYVFLRIGTNGACWGAPIDDTTKAQYLALFSKILGYSTILIVQAVPPVLGYESSIATWNVWLQSQCAINSSRMVWMDDAAGLYNPDGSQNTLYFNADRVHWSNAARYQLALTGMPVLEALISQCGYSSPLTADPADVYPTQPQWFTNPANTGSSAVTGGLAGNWVDGIRPINVPAGFAGSGSVVAAEVGDPITAQWQRITLTSTATGVGSIILRSILAGRTITTSDPDGLRTVMQVRFTNIDPAALQSIEVYMQGQSTSGRLVDFYLQCGAWPNGLISNTVTVNLDDPRRNTTAESALHLLIELRAQGTLSGLSGSIDIRCINIRG